MFRCEGLKVVTGYFWLNAPRLGRRRIVNGHTAIVATPSLPFGIVLQRIPCKLRLGVTLLILGPLFHRLDLLLFRFLLLLVLRWLWLSSLLGHASFY